MTVDIAIIGCGAATERYYVPAVKKLSSSIRNLYLVDTNNEQARRIGAAVGKGRICGDYREILDRVQGAVIAVPHALHHPISVDCLRAGVNVLCEKPLAEDGRQVREMISAAAESGVALCVNNTRRMFPSFRRIKEIISQGQIGEIKSIEYVEGSTFGWVSRTGFYVDSTISCRGVLQDLGAHVIDTICWWLDGKPALREYKDDSFGGPESVTRILGKRDGCEISIILNRLLDLESWYTIVGEKGWIEGKPGDWKRFRIHWHNGRVRSLNLKTVSRNYPGFVIPILKNFLNVVNGEEKPLVRGSDVLNSVDFIQECYESRTRFSLPEYHGVGGVELPSEGQVLVTGATGFIGGRLVETLYLSNKQRVKAAVNRWSNAARLGRIPVETVQMDIMDSEQVKKALQGVTEIVHCAKGSYDVTVRGTKNLLDVALRKGVRRFVHLSTTEVYGDVSGDIDERESLQYTGNEYNRMKVDAEKICSEYIEKGVPITILRPSIVYGPFSKSWSINFANLMLRKKWALLGGIGNGKCNLIYVDDLVRAILLSLAKEGPAGESFNIVGPDVITWNQYFERYNERLGMRPLRSMRPGKVGLKTRVLQPVRIIGGVAREHFMGTLKSLAEVSEVIDGLMRRAERTLKATPHPDELKLYSKKAVFVGFKAEKILHFKPEIDSISGIDRTVEWLEFNGLLRSFEMPVCF